MQEYIAEFEAVSVRREQKLIINDLTWRLKADERWALLGLNGSGKTTLTSLLPAYNAASCGIVRVLGQQFGTVVWEDVRKRMGYVSSRLDIFRDSLASERVEDVVLSGYFASIGVWREVSERELELRDQLILDFDLCGLKERYFGSLSSGEQRRALLARAMMASPEFLVLDEPCAGVDFRAREFFLRSLAKMAERTSLPFLYVTHRLEEIIPQVTHVAILKAGKLTACGPKAEVLTEERLSELYGIDVRVFWDQGRPYLIACNSLTEG